YANPPSFQSHDPYDHRLDRVNHHPAYHRLIRESLGQGLHDYPCNRPSTGAHAYRSALVYLQTQVEQGHICPVTMTFACVPSLRLQPNLAELWLPGILAQSYDPRDLPMEQKTGLTIGMAMTEKQGGSDLRSNTTRAQ